MATRTLKMISNDDKSKIAVSVGGAITGDVNVTVDMATTTRHQAVIMLDKIKEKILEGDWETT